MRFFKRVVNLYLRFIKQGSFFYHRCRLSNKDITVISSNCLGGMVLHNLRLKFNSPFVNLYIEAADYVKLLERFDYYIDKQIEDITSANGTYPVGLLGGEIKLHFLHYDTFEDAVACWYKRCKRINKEKIYVIMVERDGCTLEHIGRFDRLPFKHKMIICSHPHEEYKSCHYMTGFEAVNEVDVLTRKYGFIGSIPLWLKVNWSAFFNQK